MQLALVVAASAALAGRATACKLLKGFDFPGTDLTSIKSSTAAGCCSACASVSRCETFTWTNQDGGTCWLKSGYPSRVFKLGAISGIRKAGTRRVDSISWCDMPGNDLYKIVADPDVPNSCLEACEKDKRCVAYTSVCSTCYLKSDVNECVYKDGALTKIRWIEV